MDSYAAIKGAFRDLVAAAGGGARAARQTRADGPLISRYGSINEPDRFPPADVIADLEQDVGDPIVTRLLADLAGYVLVPKALADAQGEDFLQHLADCSRSTAAVVAGLAEAHANDGVVDPEEAARQIPIVKLAQTELAELKDSLVRTAAGKPARVLRRVK
ncbi:hypothetical protein ACLBXM_17845 [Xanthobacteraceae bacterium A53D]